PAAPPAFEPGRRARERRGARTHRIHSRPVVWPGFLRVVKGTRGMCRRARPDTGSRQGNASCYDAVPMPSTQITGEATRILREGSRTVAHLVRVYRLRVQLPSGDSHVQEFAQTCVRVGGQKGNDLVLEDDSVSRIHFEITADDDGFVLRDLGS